jgi:hypothetical protein
VIKKGDISIFIFFITQVVDLYGYTTIVDEKNTLFLALSILLQLIPSLADALSALAPATCWGGEAG